MKVADFDDCFENDDSRIIAPDYARSKSLLDTARERIHVIIEINERNISFVFEDYYSSLLEIIQAIAFKKGYNILNHICIGYFIRDVLKKEKMFRIFDDLRYKRNSLVYYGRKMNFKVAKLAIKNSIELINQLEIILNNLV